MYYETSNPETCKLNNKDLEALAAIKKEAMKKNSK
jgi:hypothetical protein